MYVLLFYMSPLLPTWLKLAAIKKWIVYTLLHFCVGSLSYWTPPDICICMRCVWRVSKLKFVVACCFVVAVWEEDPETWTPRMRASGTKCTMNSYRRSCPTPNSTAMSCCLDMAILTHPQVGNSSHTTSHYDPVYRHVRCIVCFVSQRMSGWAALKACRKVNYHCTALLAVQYTSAAISLIYSNVCCQNLVSEPLVYMLARRYVCDDTI